MLWKKWGVFGRSSQKKISLVFSINQPLTSLVTRKRWRNIIKTCKNRIKRKQQYRPTSHRLWPGREQSVNLTDSDLRSLRNQIKVLEIWTTRVRVNLKSKIKNSSKITPLQKLSSTMWLQLLQSHLTLKESSLKKVLLQLYINQIKIIIMGSPKK